MLVIDKMKMKPRDIYHFHIFWKPEAYDRPSGIVQGICILDLGNSFT